MKNIKQTVNWIKNRMLPILDSSFPFYDFAMINQMIIMSLEVGFHKYCGGDGEYLLQAQLYLVAPADT